MRIQDEDKKYIANTYGRFPVTLVRGEGAKLYDESGKEYIDMGSGIAVNSFGACDAEWIAAVTQQLGTLQHTSNLYYSAPCVELAGMLCERTGMKKVFFGNSGAEANECAIKVARKYAADKKGADCYQIITLINSFHGRTVTTLAATGQESFHKDFLPLTEGFLYAKPNDIAGVKQLLENNRVAAVMIEVIQGEGGVVSLEESFVRELRALTEQEDVLLIVDEVQTGNGRTGKLYGYMHYDIQPDIVTTAKGLGGGLPIGVALLGEKVKDTLTPGTHGSTFGGNPVVCAGAVSILSRLTDDFLREVERKSSLLVLALSEAEGVKNVTGMGLMLGVETERDVNEVLAECRKNGVLPIKAKTKLRLLPPLNITDEELWTAVAVIKNACLGKDEK